MAFRRRSSLLRCALVSIALLAACSAKKSSDAIVSTELGRQDIGPAGGTFTAGAVTIDVPAGALTTMRTIIVNEVTSGGGDLPASTQLNGVRYVLQPDDVDFQVPVTVTVALDASQIDTNVTGALVLFRAPAGTAQWTPYGADQSDATKLVGKTTHFSQWAATGAAATSCFRGQCGAIMPPGPPDPSKLPGQNCTVPASGPGVHCEGKGPNFGLPYECRCVGSDVLLGSYQRLPPDTFIASMAVQCGAVCNAPPIKTCDLGLTCDPMTTSQWSCSTTRDPGVLCNYIPGSGISCSCTNGKSFTLPGSTEPTNDEMEAAWAAGCGGACTTAANPADKAVCPGTIEYANEGGVGCVVETAGTCKDGSYYGYECAVNDPNSPAPSDCQCKKDGKVVKTVQGSCAGPAVMNTWGLCGFPKMPAQ